MTAAWRKSRQSVQFVFHVPCVRCANNRYLPGTEPRPLFQQMTQHRRLAPGQKQFLPAHSPRSSCRENHHTNGQLLVALHLHKKDNQIHLLFEAHSVHGSSSLLSCLIPFLFQNRVVKQRAAILLSFLVASFSAFGQMTSNQVATVIAQSLTRANDFLVSGVATNGAIAVVDREGFVLGVWGITANPPSTLSSR